MVSCRCGVGMVNIITMIALSSGVEGSVNVWGRISYHHRTALHVCRGRMNTIYYQDNVLWNHVILFFHRYQDTHMFPQDNARAHVTTQYLVTSNVPLQALSPDLLPIEHLWDYLDQRISHRPQMNNLTELEHALHQKWNAVAQNTILRLIRSISDWFLHKILNNIQYVILYSFGSISDITGFKFNGRPIAPGNWKWWRATENAQ